jgi:catechol 2,3-dioxygenase-like lactoylglutathione lyase family enzyme
MQVALHHIAVQTADFDRAYEFFHDILQLDLTSGPRDFKTRRLCVFGAGPVEIELYSLKHGQTPTAYSATGVGPTHLAFATKELDAFLAKCSAKGVTVIKPPFEILNEDGTISRLAFLQGPDGEEVEIRQARAGDTKGLLEVARQPVR